LWVSKFFLSGPLDRLKFYGPENICCCMRY